MKNDKRQAVKNEPRKEQEENVDSTLEATQEELAEEAAREAEEVEEIEAEEVEEVQGLKQKLLATENALQETISQMQRLQADFSNYKKRIEKEKSEIYLYASEKLVVELLTIVDNLERAFESASKESDDSLLQGIELVLKQLKELLTKHGVEEIQALNETFDMNLHHAVLQEDADAESNTVIEVFQKGYKLHQKIIRPAMVKVSK